MSWVEMRWYTCMHNHSNNGRNPFVCTIHLPISLGKILSVSIHVGTQKMVNYDLVGQSQRKLWWRLVVMLTCM
ncbi:hypothetical protein ACHAWX_006953 [Stephanocyclus meneghinianus]